jgi:hypothetical protein
MLGGIVFLRENRMRSNLSSHGAASKITALAFHADDTDSVARDRTRQNERWGCVHIGYASIDSTQEAIQ